jgi:hypothetical protein
MTNDDEEYIRPRPPATARDALGAERRADRLRTVRRLILGILLVAISLKAYVHFGLEHYPWPWKATDTAGAHFSANDFQFGDYRTSKDLDAALHAMFPPGTPKTRLEQVLYYGAHAKIKQTDAFKWTYTYMSANRPFVPGAVAWAAHVIDHIWFVTVVYDAAGKVASLVGTVQVDMTSEAQYHDINPSNGISVYDPTPPQMLK